MLQHMKAPSHSQHLVYERTMYMRVNEEESDETKD